MDLIFLRMITVILNDILNLHLLKPYHYIIYSMYLIFLRMITVILTVSLHLHLLLKPYLLYTLFILLTKSSLG